MQVPEAALKADFKNFLWLCWKYLRLPEPTPIQYDIADYLQSDTRRRVIEAFRGVGKSWITAAYVIWRLYCDPQVKITVVSASKQAADNFSVFCFQLIGLVPEVHHLKPRADQREAKVAFDVAPAMASKDPSVKSVGITGQITSTRADEVIGDDVEIPSNSLTQQQRDRTGELIKEFDAILKPGGRVTFLGTPQCEQSMYNLMPSRGYSMRIWPARFPDAKQISAYQGRLAPCIEAWLEKDPTLVGHTTDPKRFSDQDLAEREASYGRSGFSLQFMLDTSLSDADRYPLKLADLIVMSLNSELCPPKIAWASSPELAWNDLPNVGLAGDTKYYRPMFIEKDNWTAYTGSVLAIDPAGRGKDETGYAVVKHLHGMLFLVAWGGLQGGYTPENLQFLALLAKTHKCQDLTIENNFGDGMFTELLKPVMAKVYPLCSSEKALKEVRHSTQKERRIIDTLEPVMNQHKLIIDRQVIEDDYSSTEKYQDSMAHRYQGLYQLTRITKDRGSLAQDDRLDALAMAVKYWTDSMAQDVDLQLSAHRQRVIQQQADEYIEDVIGIGSKSRNWLSL